MDCLLKTFDSVEDLKSNRGHYFDSGSLTATVFEMDYPNSGNYTWYRWNDESLETPDDYNIVENTINNGGYANGRWIRFDVNISVPLEPVSKTVVKDTAYQASYTGKPAVITITLTSTSSATSTGNDNNEANIIIGTTSGVATGVGTVIGKYSNVLSGVFAEGSEVVHTQAGSYTINLPIGWYYAIVPTTGTGLIIDSVIEQVVS